MKNINTDNFKCALSRIKNPIRNDQEATPRGFERRNITCKKLQGRASASASIAAARSPHFPRILEKIVISSRIARTALSVLFALVPQVGLRGAGLNYEAHSRSRSLLRFSALFPDIVINHEAII